MASAATISDMDKIEVRLAALELLAIERMAMDPPPLLTKLHTVIVSGFAHNASADDRTVRERALRHIEDAQRRHLKVKRGAALDDV